MVAPCDDSWTLVLEQGVVVVQRRLPGNAAGRPPSRSIVVADAAAQAAASSMSRAGELRSLVDEPKDESPHCDETSDAHW